MSDGRTIISKTQIMQLVITGGMHESFSHSIIGDFDITEMRKGLKEGTITHERVIADLDEIVPFIRDTRVVEDARIDELNEYSWMYDPAIFVVVQGDKGTDEHVMVDGTHRALRRAKEGKTTMRCCLVQLADAPRPKAGWGDNPWFDWGGKAEDLPVAKKGD